MKVLDSIEKSQRNRKDNGVFYCVKAITGSSKNRLETGIIDSFACCYEEKRDIIRGGMAFVFLKVSTEKIEIHE
jgi:hypothetical protein